MRTNFPQVRKEVPPDGIPQVLGAAASTRAHLSADSPFNHLHVPIPPLLDAVVEVDEPLAELGILRVAAVHLDEDVLDLRRLVVVRQQDGVAFFWIEERVDGRPAALSPIARFALDGDPLRNFAEAAAKIRRGRSDGIAR